MKIHREGLTIILSVMLLSGIAVLFNVCCFFDSCPILFHSINIAIFLILVLVIQFFRVPKRQKSFDVNEVCSPADGEIVVIEETEETEYFKDKRIQVSIFMSPLNVHANFYPISGKIVYQKYHPGKFLVAWNPKSSLENERTSMVIEDEHGNQLLIRQVAGALARRICYYGEEGTAVLQGSELGFIKFGSRVDLFLPLDTKIDVQIGDKVKAILTRIGHLN
jgi:phosphatidylserine decarboxylase